MEIKKRFFPAHVNYLLSLFVFQLLLFSAFRIILFLGNWHKVDELSERYILDAFLLGIRFDIFVGCYVSLVPFILYYVFYFMGKDFTRVYKLVHVYYLVVFFLYIIICCTDIPYYHYFNARLTTSVLQWMDSPKVVFNFVFGEKAFYPFLLLMLGLVVIYYFILKRIYKKFLVNIAIEKSFDLTKRRKLIMFFVLSLFYFWGMRGGSFLRPLALKDAFISNNSFINQMSINPAHSYLFSLSSFSVNYMDDNEAVENVRKFLKGEEGFDSPIARIVLVDSVAKKKKNVVFVFVESLSSKMLKRYGYKKELMPYLDSLSRESYNFTSVYSAGIHTHNGLYAGIYGFPSFVGEHPLQNVKATTARFTGLVNTLKDEGYSTSVFISHEQEFDNMGYFMRKNGYDELFCKGDYPVAEMVNNWGVSDEFLFEYALNNMNEKAKTKKPFFSTILTISTHEPPEVPFNTTFKARSALVMEQVYEYTDWSIKNFIMNCSKQEWFMNTVFIFSGDHGINMNEDNQYEMPLSFHHIPFFIYVPDTVRHAGEINKIGSQMDIFPTVMNVLKQPYINNTFGIDLFKESRPYAFFVEDDKLGIIDENKFLIVRSLGRESIYNYRTNDLKDRSDSEEAAVEKMKTYTYSMLQAANWIVTNHKESLGIKNK